MEAAIHDEEPVVLRRVEDALQPSLEELSPFHWKRIEGS